MYHSEPSLGCNLHADCDLSTLKEWGQEEGLHSEDAANTAISPQLSSTNFLPFQLHQLVQHAEMTESSHMAPFQAIPFADELHLSVLAKDSLFVFCVVI